MPTRSVRTDLPPSTPLPTRRGRGRAVAFGAALFSLAAAGCFTNPINRAPVVVSINPVGPVLHGQPASFTAVVSDPDGDVPQTTWTVESGLCPPVLGASTWPAPATTPESTYVVTDTSSQFCVWAFATDRYGAMGANNLQVDPSNRAPIARINVVLPSPVAGQTATFNRYSDFTLSGGLSSDPDGDPIHYSATSWKMTTRPPGSMASLAPCTASSYLDPSFICFNADIDGTYTVSLVVDDGTGGADATSQPASIQLVVLPDQLPCIAISDPMYGITGLTFNPTMTEPIVIKQVTDDGDPYPPLEPNDPLGVHFSWTYGPIDDPTMYNAPDLFEMMIFGGLFKTLDKIRVRLEITDRDPAHVIPAVLAGCGDSAFCAGDASRPGCFQRVTWDFDLL